MSEQVSRSKPIDKWIPWFFVLFFLVVFAVNGYFVTVAEESFTGTVTDHPYEDGITYNQTLEKAAEEKALGWQADISLQKGDVVAVKLRDKQGNPLDKAAVIAKLTRPVQDGYDFEIKLAGQGNGLYSAPADFPLRGQWNVRIFATWQNTPYQKSRMILVP